MPTRHPNDPASRHRGVWRPTPNRCLDALINNVLQGLFEVFVGASSRQLRTVTSDDEPALGGPTTIDP